MGIFSCSQPNQKTKKKKKHQNPSGIETTQSTKIIKELSFDITTTDPLPNQPFPSTQRQELPASPPSCYSQSIRSPPKRFVPDQKAVSCSSNSNMRARPITVEKKQSLWGFFGYEEG